MASKSLLVLGVLLASVLLISFEVAARELAEQNAEKANELEDQKYGGGYQGHYGGGSGGYPGHGGGGGGYPGHGGGGGRIPGHGGGAEDTPGMARARAAAYPMDAVGMDTQGGCRCCATANEVPDAEYMEEPKN
ncbi:uncharacterized protein A4U43_C05F20990 [Asparagus officinalis]|uniref:Glycine-rich protein n=1 Tax=Asparagus officinalis TaxID=4686 RepID=A0A5P1EXB0_ASPOF|nr:uncharacterized protein A4U43_C05F20990 [Asparagus officinalis]